MAAPIFVYRNLWDEMTITRGDWRAALPEANTQDRLIGKVARSETDANADTEMLGDLGSGNAKYVRVMAVVGHNMSLAGRIRFRGYNTYPTTVYDSGLVNPYTIYPSGVLQQGHPAFGATELAQEDLDDGYTVAAIHVLSAETSARYWGFEIQDSSNPDAYLDVGRVWVGYGYQPTHGMSVGARLGWGTTSRRTETEGGAAFYSERPVRRTFSLQMNAFLEDEALVYLHEVGRYAGTTKQMLLVGDSADTVHLHRRSMLCTLQRHEPLRMSRTLWSDQGFTFIEEL